MCERIPGAAKDETDPDKLYTNHTVYARDLTWKPANEAQGRKFGADPARAGNPDIVIAKLRPGQEIYVTSHAVKGVGKDHAKFSPVATCGYRLLPVIRLKEPIRGKAAERLQQCFPAGVIDIVGGEAKVVGARNDTVSREVLRHEEFKGKVELGRVRDHFICRFWCALVCEKMLTGWCRLCRERRTVGFRRDLFGGGGHPAGQG